MATFVVDRQDGQRWDSVCKGFVSPIFGSGSTYRRQVNAQKVANRLTNRGYDVSVRQLNPVYSGPVVVCGEVVA